MVFRYLIIKGLQFLLTRSSGQQGGKRISRGDDKTKTYRHYCSNIRLKVLGSVPRRRLLPLYCNDYCKRRSSTKCYSPPEKRIITTAIRLWKPTHKECFPFHLCLEASRRVELESTVVVVVILTQAAFSSLWGWPPCCVMSSYCVMQPVCSYIFTTSSCCLCGSHRGSSKGEEGNSHVVVVGDRKPSMHHVVLPHIIISSRSD